jgi:hypothetical protein
MNRRHPKFFQGDTLRDGISITDDYRVLRVPVDER